MASRYIVALDQGTTSCRAILLGAEGQVEGVAQKELTQHYPRPGWVEHDPLEIWNSQREGFDQVIRDRGTSPS